MSPTAFQHATIQLTSYWIISIETISYWEKFDFSRENIFQLLCIWAQLLPFLFFPSVENMKTCKIFHCHLSRKFMTFLRKCNKLFLRFPRAIRCTCTQENLLLWQMRSYWFNRKAKVFLVPLLEVNCWRLHFSFNLANMLYKHSLMCSCFVIDMQIWFWMNNSSIWISNFSFNERKFFNPFNEERGVGDHMNMYRDCVV